MKIMMGLGLLVLTFLSNAASVCPDPYQSSLRWGIVPSPWSLSPFSDNNPLGVTDTQFYKANILVAGFGQGVACTYKNAMGMYSIWWVVNTKIPASIDYDWRACLGGYECNTSREQCVFYTA